MRSSTFEVCIGTIRFLRFTFLPRSFDLVQKGLMQLLLTGIHEQGLLSRTFLSYRNYLPHVGLLEWSLPCKLSSVLK